LNLVALLRYALLEKGMRERGLPYTARKVLESFAGAGASDTFFADGSRWRQAAVAFGQRVKNGEVAVPG